MRIGILGGSFDPVHLGHLILAECCREACSLEKVLLIPAALSPHKQGSQPASGEARVEMLNLAIGGHAPFEVCRVELDRGGVSYTVDTLAKLKESHQEDDLYFLMGGDSLIDFPNWREPARICELATVVFVSRPHEASPDFDALLAALSEDQVARIREHHVEMPQLDISSSDLRNRVNTGRSIRFQTPRAVEKYIEAHRLYSE